MPRLPAVSSLSAPDARTPARVGWRERVGRWWRGEVATELEEPSFDAGAEERRRRAAIAAAYAPVSSAVAVPPVAAETDGVFKIDCFPVAGVVDLPARIRAECERQKEGGLTLSSSFVHDGHVFLVFKREPPPVAGGASRFSVRST